MSTKYPYLIWLDTETSGSDEHEDRLLEVGVVITDSEYPFGQREQFSSIVSHPDVNDWQEEASTWNPIVREMHEKNGLLLALSLGDGSPLAEVERELLGLLVEQDAEGRPLLAGSGVSHFDRRWLKARTPHFERQLAYPNLDVGVMRRGFDLALGDDSPDFAGKTGGTPHRALDDALDHLTEFRRYVEWVRSAWRTNRAAMNLRTAFESFEDFGR